ncbi:unnamed protein product [Pylaiella littoralis]
MALRHRKLRVKANPSCLDLSTLLEPVLSRFPNLIYVGIWYHDGKVLLYIQNDHNMSALTLGEQVEKAHVDIVDISSYSTTEGELQEEWRSSLFVQTRPLPSTPTLSLYSCTLWARSLFNTSPASSSRIC